MIDSNPVSDMDVRLAVAQKMLNDYYELRVNVSIRKAHQVQALLRGTLAEYETATQALRDAERKLADHEYQIIELMGVDQ